jgi:hypothetical protein
MRAIRNVPHCELVANVLEWILYAGIDQQEIA